MQFSPSDLDSKAYSSLSALPADDQASALNQFFATSIGQMKNPSAYLAGVVRSIRGSGARGDNVVRNPNTAVSKQLDLMHRKCGALLFHSPYDPHPPSRLRACVALHVPLRRIALCLLSMSFLLDAGRS